jgi:hypothetical protein
MFNIFGIAGVLICISIFSLHVQPVFAQDPVPTPTYDPLAQPELPPNPTELEMGRYLFWRHCMPCHGDVGQGLTDEFRVLWEDHANCWDRGCHGGRKEDEGFPIPTLVPAIVTGNHLMQFTSEDDLFEYLKATHPPQYPGFLEDEEYHDIALIVFKMNERPMDRAVAIPSPMPAVTFVPTYTATPNPPQSKKGDQPAALWLIAILSLGFFVVTAFWIIQKPKQKEH